MTATTFHQDFGNLHLKLKYNSLPMSLIFLFCTFQVQHGFQGAVDIYYSSAEHSPAVIKDMYFEC